MEYVLLLVVGAVLVNFIVRKVVAKVDREPSVPEHTDAPNPSSVGPEQVVRAWGRVATTPGSHVAGPLPFSENNEFTQIGVWGDGSEVIARRDASDGSTYLADLEDATPDQPKLLAASFDEYLRKAWSYDADSRR